MKMKVRGMKTYMEPTPVPKMPAGLVELMEGLSREVLKNNPSEVYKFCAQHMKNLLVLRDGTTTVKYLSLEEKIDKANKAIKRRAEERRRNFDNNMRLQDNTEEQSFGDGIKVAAIVLNADNLNTKDDSELCEEQDEIPLQDVKHDSNLDTGIIKCNEHKTTDENKVKKYNCNSDIKTKHHANDNAIMNNTGIVKSTDAPNNSQVGKQENIIDVGNDVQLNVGQDINDDENDKPMCRNGGENDSDKIVKIFAINAAKEVNPENIQINEVSNVEVCELDIDDIIVKEENVSKLNNDTQSISKVEAEQNNILIAQEGNEQNYNVSGDNNKETVIVTTSDSLKDSKSNDDEIIKNNLLEKYSDETQFTANDVIEPKVTDTNAKKEVDSIISEKTDDMNIETIIDTDKLQNQTNITKIVEKDSQINNLNTKQIDIETIIMTEDNVADNVNNEQDKTTNEMLIEIKALDKASDGMSNDNTTKVALISEKQMDEITDCDTDVTKINYDKIRVDSDKTKLNNHQKDDSVINIESEQDQDKKNDTICYHDNSQLLNQEPNDIESKNSNVPETDNLKGSKPMDLETAAITIQKVFRNFLFRNKTSSIEEPSNIELNIFGRVYDTKDENDFTLRNQIKDRRVMGISRMDTVLQTVNEEKSLSLSTDDSSTISSAATVIQAHIRGFLCRNRLSGNKVTTSTTSLNTSKDSSPVLAEDDADLIKNKTVLNIHIVPESGQFVSRDESVITSMELSLDGSPPASANLHPLGYDKSERGKQLKREDAIQSISPPSNNSRLSEEQDSVKEVSDNEVENDNVEKSDSEMTVNSELGVDQQERIRDVLIPGNVETVNNVEVMQPPDSQISITIFSDDLSEKYSPEENLSDVPKQSKENEIAKEVYIEETKSETEKNDGFNILTDSQNNPICNKDALKVIGENDTDAQQKSKVLNGREETHQQLESVQNVDTQLNISTPHDHVKENKEMGKAATEISSDELDVVTPFTPTEEKLNSSDEPKLLHSGEFHDVVLPTKVSRNDTSVVSGE